MTRRSSSRPSSPSADEINRFYSMLGDGIAHAQTAEQLAVRLGFGTGENAKRRVRLLAEHAGDYNLLIVSDGDGYCRAEKPEDCESMFARFRSQIQRMSRRLAQARRLRDLKFPGEQLGLWKQEK